MKEKVLGKIDSAKFGIGGYQDAMIGLHLSFTMNGSGVCQSLCAWDANMIKHSEYCKWTEEDRSKEYDQIMRKISDILNDSKKSSVSDLAGVPVELEFEGNSLKDWRVLTEVL